MSFGWQSVAADGQARAGRLHTAHGVLDTPVFMPVGTAATVKAMTADAVRSTGASIVLGNTYHLMLRPGAERVEKLGGLHRFMDWPGPILTDSGGFQIMSLGALRTLDADGVTFRSHLDGSKHRLTPESAVGIQHQLGSTVTMVLDECTPFPATHEQAEASMAMSMRWAARSRAAFRPRGGYALFGIVQGGVFADLRARSAAALRDIGFDGYAIGGLAVGEGQASMFGTLDFVVPHLPADQPRYLMGVGTPDDLLGAVQRGVDMFDCVMPTRAGRTGRAYTSRGVLNMRNACHADDPGPIDPACACPACARHGRAYLHHLFKAGEMLGPMLLTWHNLAYYQALMRGMRVAIVAGRLRAFAEAAREAWGGRRFLKNAGVWGDRRIRRSSPIFFLLVLPHRMPAVGDPNRVIANYGADDRTYGRKYRNAEPRQHRDPEHRTRQHADTHPKPGVRPIDVTIFLHRTGMF